MAETENSSISSAPGVAQLGPTSGGQTVYLSNLFNPSTSLESFFSTLFYTALAIGAVLAVLRLGYAGFMYMTSDIWSNKEKAKGIIQEAVLGLLLLMAVWLILAQINPDILNLNILRSVPEQQGVNTGGLRPAI